MIFAPPVVVLGAVCLLPLLLTGDSASEAKQDETQTPDTPSPLAPEVAKPTDGAADQEDKEKGGNTDSGQVKPEDKILEGATPGRKTKGRSALWEKNGGTKQANEDFDNLKPDNIQNIDGGGTLNDGRKVNVRDKSSDGRPTLEIQDEKDRIKIRYNE